MIETLIKTIGFTLVTAFAGFNIVAAYDRKGSLSALETAGLSYLFGIGAISLELFIFGLFGANFITAHIILPWAVLAAINIPAFKKKFGAFFQKRSGGLNLRYVSLSRSEIIVVFLLIFVICYAFFMALVRPIESYDAVAIWSLKAKILYLAQTMRPDFFAVVGTKFQGAHPDYPLLVPFSQVWLYTFVNSFNDHLVKVIFPLSFTAFLAVFYSFLKRATANRLLALIFTFLLASVRQFSNYATNGYADMHMAIYASLTFLTFYLWTKEKSESFLWTAFFSCVFAIWTKNEGAVVLLGFILVAAVFGFTGMKKRGMPHGSQVKTIAMASVLIALFIAWSLFKNYIKVQNDVVNAETFVRYDPLGMFKRLFAILYEYQRQAFGVKYWNFSWIAFIFLSVLGSRKLFSEENRYITIPLFFILACYTAVYFITPQDILWHLRTSASRLLIHILPLAIFYVAMRVNGICSDELKVR